MSRIASAHPSRLGWTGNIGRETCANREASLTLILALPSPSPDPDPNPDPNPNPNPLLTPTLTPTPTSTPTPTPTPTLTLLVRCNAEAALSMNIAGRFVYTLIFNVLLLSYLTFNLWSYYKSVSDPSRRGGAKPEPEP